MNTPHYRLEELKGVKWQLEHLQASCYDLARTVERVIDKLVAEQNMLEQIYEGQEAQIRNLTRELSIVNGLKEENRKLAESLRGHPDVSEIGECEVRSDYMRCEK